MLVVALVDGEGAGRYARFAGSELRVGGGAAVRAVKEFVRGAVDGSAEGLLTLPAFPPPDIPRKQARYTRDVGEIQGKYGGDVGEL